MLFFLWSLTDSDTFCLVHAGESETGSEVVAGIGDETEIEVARLIVEDKGLETETEIGTGAGIEVLRSREEGALKGVIVVVGIN